MKKTKIISKSMRLSDLSFDEFYENDLEPHYQFKAERIQTRRWRQVKNQIV